MQTAGIAAAHVALAGIGFHGKIAAGTRAVFVDGAADFAADAAFQGDATSGMIACAPHVGASAEDRILLGQCGRHPTTGFGVEFLARENYWIGGATGAAACTDSHACSPDDVSCASCEIGRIGVGEKS